MRNFTVDYTPEDVDREKIAAGSCICSQLHWRSDVGKEHVCSTEKTSQKV
jgi:hypothetical protein